MLVAVSSYQTMHDVSVLAEGKDISLIAITFHKK
jgi:hypothetical protein